MEPFQLDFEYEESPASNTAIALYTTVNIQGAAMNHILDVEEFFISLEKPGIYPLFTCSCGNFGCGGYYVEVVHDPSGLRLKNSYHPLEAPTENSLLERFEFKFSWRDVRLMARQIQALLREIRAKWPDYSIYSGTYSNLDLAEKLPVYDEILARLDAKF